MSSQHPAAPTQRLFVAADLPRALLDELAVWQRTQLAAHGEVRPSRALHLTLCFLGDTPTAAVPTLTASLKRVRLQPYRVGLGAPFFLPQRGRKRVVAVALRPAQSAPDDLAHLQDLQAEVSTALTESGRYQPERRTWLPHITVARFRRPGKPFPLENVTFSEVCVTTVTLYASVLGKGGAVHTPLASFTAA